MQSPFCFVFCFFVFFTDFLSVFLLHFSMMDHPHQPFVGSLWKRLGCGGNIYEPDPNLMSSSFFLLLMCFISMINIAKAYAYIICKPVQLHVSVFQFLSQCLSFNILICSSLIWDLQSICFVPPLMCRFKRNMSSAQVSSLSRFCSRNKHSFCILVILAHIMTQSLPGCYIGGIHSPQLTSLQSYEWRYVRRERCSGNEGKWWGNPLTSVLPITAWNPSTKPLCLSV